MEDKMKEKLIFLVFLLAFCFMSCAVIPSTRVPRPWYQIRESKEPIKLNSKISITVKGKTEPLIGEETLLQGAIFERLGKLLERRGYKIVSAEPDYQVTLTYDIKRHDNLHSSMASFERGGFVSLRSRNEQYGLGVMVAQALSVAIQQPQTTIMTDVSTLTSYTHTISLEIFDTKGNLKWKGDSTWESQGLDIEREVTPSLQLILSSLPSDGKIIPRVRKVQASKADTYFDLNVKNYWFTCPALPYRISCKKPTSSDYRESRLFLKNVMVNSEAFEAFIDIMLTAEYALPDGNKNYKDPFDKSNWAKVILGGQYYLGNGTTPQNILIWLRGSTSEYTVEKCQIVSEEGYVKFTQRLEEWKKALSDKLDFFE